MIISVTSSHNFATWSNAFDKYWFLQVWWVHGHQQCIISTPVSPVFAMRPRDFNKYCVIFTYGRLEKIQILTARKTLWIKSKKYSFQDASDVTTRFSCDLQKLLSLLQDGSRSTNLVHLLKESASDTPLQWLVRPLSHGHVTLKNTHISAFSEVAHTKLGQQVHLLDSAGDARCRWRHCCHVNSWLSKVLLSLLLKLPNHQT